MMKSAGNAVRHMQIRISAPSFAPLNSAFVRLVESYASDPSVSFSINTFTTIEAVQKLVNYELDIAILLY